MSHVVCPATAVTIPAVDGYPLGATLHLPGQDPPLGLVILHPATAVPARYYAPFALALAARGLAAVTYDYRGIGASRPARLRGFGATMRDWINLDAEGVTRWARAAHPGLALLAVGHSLGGHAIGLCDGSRHLAGAALVSSAAAWIGHIPAAAERARVAALLRVVGPGLLLACGYVPMRRLGLGEDLPGPAFQDWAQWIGMRHYFFDDPLMNAAARFARVRAPLLLIGAADDPWTPAAAIDELGSRFTAAAVERWQVSPADAETRPVGHAGFFRREHGATLWPRMTDWLLRRAGQAASLMDAAAHLHASGPTPSASAADGGGRLAPFGPASSNSVRPGAASAEPVRGRTELPLGSDGSQGHAPLVSLRGPGPDRTMGRGKPWYRGSYRARAEQQGQRRPAQRNAS